MMCCNRCPFHPQNGSAKERCDKPSCNLPVNSVQGCTSYGCPQDLGMRCFMDYYVINNLHQSKLAKQLALHTLKTALMGRDRPLLMALFYAADKATKIKLWGWLNANLSRSLWLLNPIFSASGLPNLEYFDDSPQINSKYIEALSTNEVRTTDRNIAFNFINPRRKINEL